MACISLFNPHHHSVSKNVVMLALASRCGPKKTPLAANWLKTHATDVRTLLERANV